MVDLSTSGRRLAEFHLEPPTPPDSLQKRARRRRQKRRGVAGTLAAVVVAGVALAAVTLAGSGGQKVEVGSSGPRLVGTHPKGWVEEDFGRLALWSPTNSGGIPCYDEAHDLVAVGPERTIKNGACPLTATAQGAPLVVRASRAAPLEWAQETINGLPVWLHTSAGGATIYDVPSLDVSIEAVGKVPNEMAKTLGPSLLEQSFADKAVKIASRGAGSRLVHYDGLSFRVPSSWPVQTLSRVPGYSAADPGQCTLDPYPAVLLGDPAAECTSILQNRIVSQLWMGPNLLQAASATVTFRNHLAVISDFRVNVEADNLIAITIHAGGGRVVHATMCVTDPALAQRILASFTD